MIRTSPATIRRAAATLLAAAVLPFLVTHASAQTSVDLLAGNIPNTVGDPATLSVSTTLTLGGASVTGPFGVRNYNGTVTVGAGLLNTLSEGFDTVNGANRYVITSGGVLNALGTVSANKTFGAANNQLAPNTTYVFTLTSSSASTLSLLNNFNIALSDSGGTFLNTANGTGLLGIVNVLGLFNNNGVATFQFTTPATVTGTGLNVAFTSNVVANALGSQIVFSGATINQVPEPHTVVAMLLGMGGLTVLRNRRRLAAV